MDSREVFLIRQRTLIQKSPLRLGIWNKHAHYTVILDQNRLPINDIGKLCRRKDNAVTSPNRFEYSKE